MYFGCNRMYSLRQAEALRRETERVRMDADRSRIEADAARAAVVKAREEQARYLVITPRRG
eukprot:scaffold24454_cov36-Phaeocystis_antarctica.AAC.1